MKFLNLKHSKSMRYIFESQSFLHDEKKRERFFIKIKQGQRFLLNGITTLRNSFLKNLSGKQSGDFTTFFKVNISFFAVYFLKKDNLLGFDTLKIYRKNVVQSITNRFVVFDFSNFSLDSPLLFKISEMRK